MHEGLVAVEVPLLAEVGCEQEVQVASRGVPGNARQEAMLAEQPLKVLRGLAHAGRRHAHVLDDHRDPWRPHRGEQALHPLSDPPQHLDLVALAREPGRVEELASREDLHRSRLRRVQVPLPFGPELDEQRRGARG